MDTALVIISLLSLALAGSLLVYAGRLQREQRQRARARVDALAAAIAEPAANNRGEPPWATLVPPAGQVPLFRDRVTGAPSPADRGLTTVDRDLAPPTHESGRLVALGVTGAMCIVAVMLTAALASPGRRTAAPAAAAASATHLELRALDAARTGDSLVVSGTVRNPGTAVRTGLQAVVFSFDDAGSVVTSARAPIDRHALAAGESSAFTVRVPGAARTAKYRVSFRDDAAMVAHVDKRTRNQAVSQGSTGSAGATGSEGS